MKFWEKILLDGREEIVEGKVFTTYSGERLVGKQGLGGNCTDRI